MKLVDHKAALESEKVVLQSVLLENDLFYRVERLKAEHFQTGYHRKIFDVIAKRIQNGQAVDEVILADHFKGNGIGEYLISFDASSTRKLEPHVEEIIRAAHRREILQALQDAVAQANDLSEENEAVLEVTYDRIMELAEYAAKSRSLQLKDFSDNFYDRVIKVSIGQAETGALETGLAELDEITGGMFPGEFVVIGGWTNEGKTPFVMQIIAANCDKGVPCLLFSQEMTRQAVLSRFVPMVTKGKIVGQKLRNPRRMDATDRAIFSESKAVLDSWPLWVNDASAVDAGDFASHATVMIRKYGIRLVAVDYIQLMRGEGDSRAERVSACSAALRELAKNSKVVVLGVSQFGRPSEKIKRRPVLFDLKESGDVENDAHMVLFVHRPLDRKTKQFTMEDEIIVAKQREGVISSVPVVFDHKQLVFLPRFVERTPERPEGWWEHDGRD